VAAILGGQGWQKADRAPHLGEARPPGADAPGFGWNGQPVSPARQRFLQRLVDLSIKPTAREYYVQWAEAWTKARGNRSADATSAFFDALGRSTHLEDWQFRQAVDAVYILAHDIFALPWAGTYDWQGLADQARALEPDHRTLGRETIRVHPELPALPAGASGHLPETDAAWFREFVSCRIQG
jgi:hypothetical protein